MRALVLGFVGLTLAGCGLVEASAPGVEGGSSTCARVTASDRGRQRTILVPPAPAVRAVAVTERTTRIEWRFAASPAACRPASVLVSVQATTSSDALPTTELVAVRGRSGSVEIAYADFLPPPDVARVSASTRTGRRSETVTVRIQRSGDVPADPPDPVPPLVAPAGEPATCDGPTSSFADAQDDVLTYAVGSPPAEVERMTEALAGVDVVDARMGIDGRTLCARLVLAQPPRGDFGVLVVLRDTSTLSCCAALRFRRIGRRLEVGHETLDADGRYALGPVERAGARLDGAVLTITGTLPPPSRWQLGSRMLPRTENLAWSVTTSYTPMKYGPYFGDWVPKYADTLEPVVRHRDGEVVVPSR